MNGTLVKLKPPCWQGVGGVGGRGRSLTPHTPHTQKSCYIRALRLTSVLFPPEWRSRQCFVVRLGFDRIGNEQSLHRLTAIDDQGVSDNEGSRV
ncbi:hypothetical protein [Nostoc sp. UIC 10630]|uniref:hypothetical protein n=1 Tax=Nostoc sp. UIC 10630 TaxID=2100146 RepID=UPI0013D16F25|nr:hypothetical protein [Nostoc sp. UIC 10630]NEU80189.1 hypothetical protein [Nostoc sp. UIC 10630]